MDIRHRTLLSFAPLLTVAVALAVFLPLGIASDHLTRIFSHGFTTRRGGHGFGLHSCALAAEEMSGVLSVKSDGAGRGATFTLVLPLRLGSAAALRPAAS
ncbi:ATP-binding protein [Sorangium sp. So ce887]